MYVMAAKMLIPFGYLSILGLIYVVMYGSFIYSFNKIICEPIMYLAKLRRTKYSSCPLTH